MNAKKSSRRLRSPAEIDVCKINRGGCEQRCVNRGGQATCYCHTGFKLADDGRNCHGKIVPIDLRRSTLCDPVVPVTPDNFS